MSFNLKLNLLLIFLGSILFFVSSSYVEEHQNFHSVKKDVSHDSFEIIFIFRNDDLSALSNPEHEKKIIELFKKYHISQKEFAYIQQ